MAQLAIAYSNGRPNFRVGLRKDEHMKVFEADPTMGTSRRVLVSRKGNRLYLSAAKTTLVDINKSYSSTYTPARSTNSVCITCCSYPERLDMSCDESIPSRDVPTGFSGRDLYIDLPKDFITKSWPDSEVVELNAKKTKRWVKQNNIAEKYGRTTRQKSWEQPDREPEADLGHIHTAAEAGAELERKLTGNLNQSGAAQANAVNQSAPTHKFVPIDPVAQAAALNKSAAFDELRRYIVGANKLCIQLNCELIDDNGKTLLPTGFHELAFTTHKVV